MHMQPPEKIIVKTHTIACDGGGGALGHPQVFLTLDTDSHTVDCPYCGRHFMLDPKAKAHGRAH